MYKSKAAPRDILVIRNDKLGDFILSFPAFALLKSALPGCKIHVLVPRYTADMAAACPWIDETILDPGAEKTGLREFNLLVLSIKRRRFGAVITLFSTTRIGLAVFLAGIAQRFAPATKLAQIFYNHRLAQRRSRSEKPEHVYNLDLAKYCLNYFNIALPPDPAPPYLRFDPREIDALRAAFCETHRLKPGEQLVFLHPGSGGSASNLSFEQYARLADALNSTQGHTVVITAGPGELQKAQSVANLIEKSPHVIYQSTQGLLHFAKLISCANVFISGSTGPLHIAGALDVPTAGFYTRRLSATSLRWQTLNSARKRLAFSPPQTAGGLDMSSIDVAQAAAEISRNFLR